MEFHYRNCLGKAVVTSAFSLKSFRNLSGLFKEPLDQREHSLFLNGYAVHRHFFATDEGWWGGGDLALFTYQIAYRTLRSGQHYSGEITVCEERFLVLGQKIT